MNFDQTVTSPCVLYDLYNYQEADFNMEWVGSYDVLFKQSVMTDRTSGKLILGTNLTYNFSLIVNFC